MAGYPYVRIGGAVGRGGRNAHLDVSAVQQLLNAHLPAHGQSIYINAPFRVFSSLADAFDLHGKLLAENPAYVPVRTHLDDPDAYADALTHHYATDSQYGSTLKKQMKAYNLYQYNQ